jgi:hypothetical protein
MKICSIEAIRSVMPKQSEIVLGTMHTGSKQILIGFNIVARKTPTWHNTHNNNGKFHFPCSKITTNVENFAFLSCNSRYISVDDNVALAGEVFSNLIIQWALSTVGHGQQMHTRPVYLVEVSEHIESLLKTYGELNINKYISLSNWFEVGKELARNHRDYTFLRTFMTLLGMEDIKEEHFIVNKQGCLLVIDNKLGAMSKASYEKNILELQTQGLYNSLAEEKFKFFLKKHTEQSMKKLASSTDFSELTINYQEKVLNEFFNMAKEFWKISYQHFVYTV